MTAAAANDSAGAGNVTLTLKHITDNEPAFKKLIAEYKKVAPNVTIQPSYAPVDDLQTSLRAQLGGGNAPDLFVVWPGNGSAMSVQQLAPAGVLADISDQRWIKNVPENLRPLLGTDGKTYMYSSGVTPIGAIYNKQVLAEAGVRSRRRPGASCWRPARRSRPRARPASRSATRRRGSRS